jgi:hypothetical protein
MRKNYYGRRKKDYSNSANNFWKKYQELTEKARSSIDPIEKISLYQRAEYYYKKSKNLD